jgi:hypothetical protein
MYVMYHTGFECVLSYDKISSRKLKLIPLHHTAMVICPCLLYLNGLTAILLIYDFNTQSRRALFGLHTSPAAHRFASVEQAVH